jgi:hypothetical protein
MAHVALILSFLFAGTTWAQSHVGAFHRGLALQEALVTFAESRSCPPTGLTDECQRPLSANELSALKSLMRDLEAWRAQTDGTIFQGLDVLKGLPAELREGSEFAIQEARRWRGLSRQRYLRITWAPDAVGRAFEGQVLTHATFELMLFDQLLRLSRALVETPRLLKVMEFDTAEGSLLERLYGPLMQEKQWFGVMHALNALAQIERISPQRQHDPALVAFEQYTAQSYSAQKLCSSERAAFVGELGQLAKVLAQTRRSERLNRLIGRLSQIFGNAAGQVQTRSGKLRPLAQDPRAMRNLRAELRPLDVLLEKTPFRLTDRFIPGFYGHVAIWLGPIEQWGEWPVEYQGQWIPVRLHPVVRNLLPLLQQEKLVLESLRLPGVTLNTLEHFMDIDDLLVLRSPELRDPGAMLVKALQQYGKPYDFNFDVETERELVCSELIYQVFTDENWPTESTLGRYTISPDHVAQKALEGRLDVELLYHDGRRVSGDLRAKLGELLRGPAALRFEN